MIIRRFQREPKTPLVAVVIACGFLLFLLILKNSSQKQSFSFQREYGWNSPDRWDSERLAPPPVPPENAPEFDPDRPSPRPPRNPPKNSPPRRQPPKKGDRYFYDLDEAVSDARTHNRDLYVMFYADWCSWCKKMKAETLEDPNVSERLDRHSVALINTERFQALARRYRVTGIPVSLLMNKEGRTLKRKSGFMDTPAFLRWID